MSRAPYRDAVIAAADALLNATKLLPAEGSPRASVRAALKRIDEAEERLDVRMRAYMGVAAEVPGG